jgi:aminoglycoside phosphotransferase (APT) family kinase protein
MPQFPADSALVWAASAISPDARVVSIQPLHGDLGPWWLRVDDGAVRHDAVLRVPGRVEPRHIRTGAAALHVAEGHGLPAPRLIAEDLEGRHAGASATLETALPGTSQAPRTVSAERLRRAGAAIARVHAIRLEPQSGLPLRVRSTSTDDHALERRWAHFYRSCRAAEKPAAATALMEQVTVSSPLLELADDRIRALGRPRGETVLVHGDIWEGNMRWDGDTFIALIDWKDAGAGDPGVDLGQLRMQMSIQYGRAAAAYALDGWQIETGRPAENLPYWDIVAALNTPAILDGPDAFAADGSDLDRGAATRRRDEFLRAALDQLDANSRTLTASRYAG